MRDTAGSTRKSLRAAGLRGFLGTLLLLATFSLTACASGDARSNENGSSGTRQRTTPSTLPKTVAGSSTRYTRSEKPSERKPIELKARGLSGKTPADAAYKVAASGLPGVTPESVGDVYHSGMDPSWASVRIADPGPVKVDFVVFLEKKDGVWRARYSILADDPDHPENDTAALVGVPDDLLKAIYPEKLAAFYPNLRAQTVNPDGLPRVSSPDPGPLTPTEKDMPRRLEKGVENIKKAVGAYDGTVGVYVWDLKGGWGYGVRPDEEFFSASVIKVPVMVAVYREIDSGSLSLSDTFETRPGDWASGAGSLQWEKAGTPHTVGDYLWRMITQSDNVAANALVRIVGGVGHVNRVARSMGASDTLLYQKITSERAITTSLDNRTTPRDMATMLRKIAQGKAASPRSCKSMVDLLRANVLESWLEAGIPKGVAVANKAGWIYEVYDEVGIVFDRQRPYAVAILSKGGPADPRKAKPALEKISASIWQTQNLP